MIVALILAFLIGVFSVLLSEAFLLYKWWSSTGEDDRKLYPQRTKVTNPEVIIFETKTLQFSFCVNQGLFCLELILFSYKKCMHVNDP